MKQLAELIPIILFFVVYQMDGYHLSIGGFSYTFDGIFSATAVLMVATTIQIAWARIATGRLEKRQLWLLLAVLAFGGLTLGFRNQLFIQWKPTVFNWGLGAVFLGSEFIGDRNLLERSLGSQVILPRKIWSRVNWLWIANFFIVGALNIYVAYQFSQSAWVSYKLYSSIGFTVVLSALTVWMIAPHMKDEEDVGSSPTD